MSKIKQSDMTMSKSQPMSGFVRRS
jgi:hypothetical protein